MSSPPRIDVKPGRPLDLNVFSSLEKSQPKFSSFVATEKSFSLKETSHQQQEISHMTAPLLPSLPNSSSQPLEHNEKELSTANSSVEECLSTPLKVSHQQQEQHDGSLVTSEGEERPPTILMILCMCLVMMGGMMWNPIICIFAGMAIKHYDKAKNAFRNGDKDLGKKHEVKFYMWLSCTIIALVIFLIAYLCMGLGMGMGLPAQAQVSNVTDTSNV